MAFLVISDPVRSAFGQRNAERLDAGDGRPEEAQCWRCGRRIDIAGARHGEVSVSAVVVDRAAVTAFAHAPCSPSLALTPEEFEASCSTAPSPVAPSPGSVLVEGERIA